MRVVITGVSGSLGSFLAADLVSRGYQVLGVSRTDPKIPGVRHISQDLTLPFDASMGLSAVPKDFSDCAVINCAAVTRDGWSSSLETDNLAITRNALLLSSGPFLQVSSSSVYNLAKPSVKVTEAEATGLYPFLNSYSKSKFETERLVVESGVERFAILRPHALVGPNDNTLGPRVRRAIRNGRLVLPGGGVAMHEFTNFANFAQAVRLTLDAFKGDVTLNRAVNISNGVAVPIREAIREGLGADAPGIKAIPVGLAWGLAGVLEKFAGRDSEPRISRYQVAQLAYERTYDLRVAREVLGYRPEN